MRAVGDRFRVTLADGRQLTVDGPAFAKVLMASSAYRELIAGGAPAALVVTDGEPSAVREFQARLASTFHVHTQVLVPGAEWTVYSGLSVATAPEDDAVSGPGSDSGDAWSMAGSDSVSDVETPRSISLADFLGGTPPREEDR